MRLLFAVLWLLCAAGAGCNRDDQSPDGGDGGGGAPVTGGDRLAWDQPLDDPGDLASLRFTLWVDDVAGVMTGVACALPVNLVAACAGALRAMAPGAHTLALSALAPGGDESLRSEPLSITVSGAGVVALFTPGALPRSSLRLIAARSSRLGPLPVSESGGVAAEVSVARLASGLLEPTDVVVTPAGRTLIAERRGVVREFADGRLRAAPILVLEDVVTAEGGLLGLTLDRDHARNGLIYVAYAATTGFRLARYRLVAGSLGEGAVIFETVLEAPVQKALLRSGPDGRLYLGLDNGGDELRSGDLGSYSGKLLKLETSGRVPTELASNSPVYLSDLQSPAGVDWHPADGAMWLADESHGTGGGLYRVLDAGPRQRPLTAQKFALPDRDEPTAVAFYRGVEMPEWQGNLLLAMRNSGQLLRFEVAADGSPEVPASHEVLDGTLGLIEAITRAPDGSVYLTAGDSLLQLTHRR